MNQWSWEYDCINQWSWEYDCRNDFTINLHNNYSPTSMARTSLNGNLFEIWVVRATKG